MSDTGTPIQNENEEFEETPQGEAQRWTIELAAAKKSVEKWHKQGEKIVKRFLDERDQTKLEGDTRINLFSANIITQGAMLYGQVPSVDVSRRFADPKDEVARVSAEMLERMLNSDLTRDSDGYVPALQYALQDFMLTGLGVVRLRYVADFEQGEEEPAILDDDGTTEKAPAVPPTDQKTREDVETDYVFWKDCLWSPARTFHDLRWFAFRAQMSKPKLIERFGEDKAKNVPMNTKRAGKGNDGGMERDPRARADVWEVWDKERRKVCWFVEGMGETLDEQDDPLGLDGFWPFAKPMFSNATTTALMPRPDFVFAQDLYDEIDAVSTRITMLERAIRVAGAYDKTNTALKRLVSETGQNELVPVENWSALAEKGGFKGVIDWLPLDQFAAALDKLRDYRQELKSLLYEVTGYADIMRGETDAAETLGAQQIKSKFASVRVQAKQNEFARFASDTQRLKAEIIAKHFDPQTIVERSNIQFGFDQQYIIPAVQLIKSAHYAYRIEVKPEAVAMADFASMQNEATQIVQAISTFLTAAGPAATAIPGSTPMLLEMLQWVVARFKGSSTIEGVLDQAIAQAQQAAQQPKPPPPPDPKVQAAQIKASSDAQKLQADAQKPAIDLQADLMRIRAEEDRRSRELAQEAQVERQNLLIKEQLERSRPQPMRGPQQ